jgi:hypothetical protein
MNWLYSGMFRSAVSQKVANDSNVLTASIIRAIMTTDEEGRSRLGGVVVSVLATGPKVRGFEPGRGDGFLGDKNPQHNFLSDGK